MLNYLRIKEEEKILQMKKSLAIEGAALNKQVSHIVTLHIVEQSTILLDERMYYTQIWFHRLYTVHLTRESSFQVHVNYYDGEHDHINS